MSGGVLEAVARALHLSDAEHEHLFNLARAAKPVRAYAVATASADADPSGRASYVLPIRELPRRIERSAPHSGVVHNIRVSIRATWSRICFTRGGHPGVRPRGARAERE